MPPTTPRLRWTLASICSALTLTSAQAETLVLAPLPMEAPETVVKQFKPMLNYLEQRLPGVQFRIDYSSSYQEVLDKFQQGKVDVAYLGPLPYVALKAQFGAATPLVHFLEASGQPTYTCAIVSTNAKTRLKSLKGVKVALTQPLSTCGYLATDGLLQQAGNTLMAQQYRYLNQHDAVALAVASGEFELGGIKTAIARQYAHLGLQVVAETAPLPSFALIANGQKLSPQRQQTLRQVLTSLSPLNNPADRSITQSWGNNLRHGAVNASDADYESVRGLRRRARIPEYGNF